MYSLKSQRIPFKSDIDIRLRTLKSRTGITPNILCRLGFCLSLEEQGIPSTLTENDSITREINRYTLLGKYDFLFEALMKIWLKENEISLEHIDEMFIAHMNRGAEIIASRVKTVTDIHTLTQATNPVLS